MAGPTSYDKYPPIVPPKPDGVDELLLLSKVECKLRGAVGPMYSQGLRWMLRYRGKYWTVHDSLMVASPSPDWKHRIEMLLERGNDPETRGNL